MSELKTFFRHCPSCGRRFEIRLVGKELVSQEKEEVDTEPTPGGAGYGGGYAGGQPEGYTILRSVEEPHIVNLKDFNYTYKCAHCGHIWSETKFEEASGAK